MTAEQALALARVRWPGAHHLMPAWWGREGAVDGWHVLDEEDGWIGNVEAFADQGTWLLTPGEKAPDRWSPAITVQVDEVR